MQEQREAQVEKFNDKMKIYLENAMNKKQE